jgi:hypothetical protein
VVRGVVSFWRGRVSGSVAGTVPGGPSCPHTGWHCCVEYLEQLGESSAFEEGRCMSAWTCQLVTG